MKYHRRAGLSWFAVLMLALLEFGGCEDTKSPVTPGAGGAGDGGFAGSTGGSDAAEPVDGAVADGPPGSTFSKAALIGAIAECTAGRYADFLAAAMALQSRIANYAASLAAADLAEAQAAWRTAMARWQEAELLQFGPAGTGAQPGGQGLRLQIYSYPAVFRCGIDRRIVDRSYAAENFPSSNVNVRGLDALEYLLFHVGSSNNCTTTDPINAMGTWAALDGAALARRRADYAVAAVADVLVRAQALVAAWAPGAANFRQQFVSAGAGSTLFATDHAALNAVSDSLLEYLDKVLKDAKVAHPSGIDMQACPVPACPDALESRFAGVSTDNLVQNILGFRRIFLGCGEGGAGLGFDDWLRAMGHAALADRMEAGIAAALESAQTLQPPLEEAILVPPLPAARVRALHAAIKLINDPLKADVFTALDLQRPVSVGTDND